MKKHLLLLIAWIFAAACLLLAGCGKVADVSSAVTPEDSSVSLSPCPDEEPNGATDVSAIEDSASCDDRTTDEEGFPGDPGYFWVDGVLFFRDEEGILLRNAEKDGLLFSETGAYTSGNEELDSQVANILAELINQNPEHGREELLRDVYDYMVENFSYLGRRVPAVEGEPWEAEEAVIMLETGKGNCQGYAAAFWALSRGLGYPTITHTNPNGQRHSWAEISFDSVPYVFDPQLAVHWKDDRFMLSYDECHRKNYTVYFNGSTADY